MLYTLKRANPDRVPAGAAGTVGGSDYIYARPLELEPPWYIPAQLGGSAFFERVEVSVDGHKIDDPKLENNGHQYQYLNRTFTNDTTRRLKYGEFNGWISRRSHLKYRAAVGAVLQANAVAGVPAQPIYIHQQLHKAMASLMYGHNIEDANGLPPKPLVASVGFDGFFPLGCQNNTLRVLTGQTNHNAFLPPGCELTLTFHLRTPRTALIERAEVGDGAYFNNNGNIPAPQRANWELEINGVELHYETCLIEKTEDLRKIRGGVARYMHDFPYMRTNLLKHDISLDTQAVTLVPGAKLMYVSFAHEVQLQPRLKENSWMSSKLTIPRYLKEIEFSITGKEGVIFKGGLQGLDMLNLYASPSMLTYYGDLTKQNIYTRGHDDLCPFPRRTEAGVAAAQALLEAEKPYDLAFVIPCLDYSFEDSKEMIVKLTYSQPAEARWRMRTFAVVQRMIEWSEKSGWTEKDLP